MSSILVVDDDRNALELFTTILKRFGYQAISASSGLAALEYMDAARPDLVILDVMMPGMNGLEVLQRMRSDIRTAAVPVVMFSALDDDDWRARATQAGASDYWIKGSLDCGELEEKVRSRLPA